MVFAVKLSTPITKPPPTYKIEAIYFLPFFEPYEAFLFGIAPSDLQLHYGNGVLGSVYCLA